MLNVFLVTRLGSEYSSSENHRAKRKESEFYFFELYIFSLEIGRRFQVRKKTRGERATSLGTLNRDSRTEVMKVFFQLIRSMERRMDSR